MISNERDFAMLDGSSGDLVSTRFASGRDITVEDGSSEVTLVTGFVAGAIAETKTNFQSGSKILYAR